ncbi:AzlD domain-containing protein [Frisingicoccus sp.]|uniref:AzlD domain-containing protein n=1 Tax=Frisingicoccus sp. TaxID=1918627 RepID=UPI003AB4CADE
MAIFVICCLKNIPTDISLIVPSLAAAVVTLVLYFWKQNTLISIAVGTMAYMISL